MHDRPHVVQFYSDDTFLLDGLSRFVGTALGAGDSAIVIATPQHRDGLAERLRGRGLHIDQASAQNRYIALDAAQTLSQFMLDDEPDAALFSKVIGDVLARATAAAEGPSPRVVAFGEMVALLWAGGYPQAAIRLERLWNDLARTHSFSLHCAYPLKGFDRDQHIVPFHQICDEHSAVIPDESYTSLLTEEERLRDIAHLQQKAEALNAEKLLRQALQQTTAALERDIAERREVEHKLRESEQVLHELSGRLLSIQDEERRRLGRDLHDTLGQYLAVLKMGLDLLKSDRRPQGEAALSLLKECADMADQSIKEIRTMSYLLYPPMLEEAGLNSAISWYVDGFARRSGIRTACNLPRDLRRLPQDVELAIFRVLQESLTNVHRHSGSATAHIELLLSDESVQLEVRDAGSGLTPARGNALEGVPGTPGVGVPGMRERARHVGGELDIISDPSGTTVRLTIPIPAAEPAAAPKSA